MGVKLFLGGTCGNNNWRADFIQHLVDNGVPRDMIFDPVVKDWNEAAQKAEEEAKVTAEHMLFFISDPKQEGINISEYSLVEATMGLYDKPETTVVVFDGDAFTNPHVKKAMTQAEKVLRKRFPSALIFSDFNEAANWFIKNL